MATQHQMLTDAYEAHIGPTPDVDAPHVDDLDAIRTTVRLASVLKRTATIELLDAARTDGRIRPGMSAVELYAQGITPPLHDIIVDDILGACLALRSLADTYLEHCDGSWDVAYADDDRRWDFTRTPGNRTLEQLADAGISSSVASRRSMGIPT